MHSVSKNLLAFSAALTSILFAEAQRPAYTGQYNFSNGDPATNFNKYLVTKEDRTYTQVGIYRVTGSAYLFGPRHKGNVYAKGETGMNITVSYNTYNQDVEYFAEMNPDKPLVKEAGTVDSFLIKKDSLVGEDLMFVYGKHLGAGDNSYYMRVVEGGKYSLYKKYHAEIGVVSTNYVESNLRQFEIEAEYFYFNEQTKQLKKLKTHASFIRKEFGIKDLSKYIIEDDLSYNKEVTLKLLFIGLNN
jgi:hypothetical protein